MHATCLAAEVLPTISLFAKNVRMINFHTQQLDCMILRLYKYRGYQDVALVVGREMVQGAVLITG
jgi:hypothetical protein